MFSLDKIKRTFLPETLDITWENLLPFFETLNNSALLNKSDLEQWLLDRSELEAVLEEDFAWRYIRMTCDTTDEKIQQSFEYFATEVEPHISEWTNTLNEKFLQCEFYKELDVDTYKIYIRTLKSQFEIFRQENIPLFTELQLEQQKYGAIVGSMSIEHDGKEYTLEQASNFIKSTDRAVRKEVYEKIQRRRLADKETLDELFDKLIKLRHQVAINAGFDNFRDYMFKALGRFDYTAEDCFRFHEAIAEELVPLFKQFSEERKSKMQLDKLTPYDTEVDVSGKPALKPFDGGEDLLNKSIACFYRIHPYFGEKLETMKQHKLIDLESRAGKAPGGYNYPLAESGAPFIFMNAANAMRDLTTMVHEGGHAVHTFLTNNLALNDFKRAPSEVAEVASMSMELISMDAWDVFFNDADDLIRAKEEQLKDSLKTLPWVATIDAFQHWIYTNPNHTVEERTAAWDTCFERFGSNFVNWEGYEEFKNNLWQKQLHLFEVPFYYIEYAIAQLAAIAIYKNYKENPVKAILEYMDALKLGYTKSIPEIYETAGIKFDFSTAYIRGLVDFMKEDLSNLKHKN
ncbi:MAG: M3 family oligoendopeptidase [Sphingobacteriales bacterium]|nr:M3 family oligoendopeptidase [Sphingobacteriales bacterium]